MASMARLLLLSAAAGLATLAEAGAGAPCTFVPHCDYGKGSRDNAPATTREECCTLCQQHAAQGCVAGVFDGSHCWFKTAGDLAHGCTHSSRAQFACLTAAAPHPPAPPPPPSPEYLALVKQYTDMREQACAKVVAKLPALDPEDEGAFTAAYANLAKNESATAPALAAAQKLLDSSDVKAFLTLPDSFTEGGLDAAMALCAVLSDATPAGLAQYAATGKPEEQLVSTLIGDFTLMRDMLVAGGPVSSENGKGSDRSGCRYGEAMGIYTNITKASAVLSAAGSGTAPDALWDDRSHANILKRVALGTALQHAVPLHRRYPNPLDPSTFFIDPVARYQHYEQAYHAGELDPAFEVLSTFEARHTTNTDAQHEDQQWLRDTMANYRPDHIAAGYGWRYAGAVKTEVAYGDPQCAKFKPVK